MGRFLGGGGRGFFDGEGPTALGVLGPNDSRLDDLNGGDGEFSDEEREESIIGGEARGLEEGRSEGGGIGDGDAREEET